MFVYHFSKNLFSSNGQGHGNFNYSKLRSRKESKLKQYFKVAQDVGPLYPCNAASSPTHLYASLSKSIYPGVGNLFRYL
jgi:hypothetical protein